MSPNQPKTPISSFRLNPETKSVISQLAEQWGTSMTGAIQQMASAMAQIGAEIRRDYGRYPFEAYTAALGAFREHMGYQQGDVIPPEVASAVDYAVIAANPIIREDQHFETLRSVIEDLQQAGAEDRVIEHLRRQLPD